MKRIIFLPLLLLASPALAEPFTYAPDSCEFQITFPEKPFIEKKCVASDCTEIVSFTKAVGIDSSTHFRVTCNTLDTTEVEKYTPDIIKETVQELAKSNNLIPYDTQSTEKDGYKNASILSLSERDGKSLIYNAQIWIGKTSMFTIEGEMLGAADESIQSTFADILKNAHPKNMKTAPTTKTVVQ